MPRRVKIVFAFVSTSQAPIRSIRSLKSASFCCSFSFPGSPLIRSIVCSYSFTNCISGESPAKIWSSTVPSSSNTGFCGRNSTRIRLPVVTVPPSGGTIPASTFRRVDLPVPFTPIIPIRSPSWMPSEILLNNVFMPYDLEMLSAVRMFIAVIVLFLEKFYRRYTTPSLIIK
ncbi:hypothetical protein D1872_201320 [compost metagenome]